jgi:putative transcriptional regulator
MRRLCVCALIALFTVPAAAWHAPAGAETKSLAGHFLVADEHLGDPNFYHAVIYICRHDETGAFGLVLNRPVAKVPFSKFAKTFGVDSDDNHIVRIYQGGPVQLQFGFVLHTTDFHSAREVCGNDRVAVSSDVDVMRAVSDGDGPKHLAFFLGYSGWGAGQLEAEIARKSWQILPADSPLLFNDDFNGLWKKATGLRGIDL